MSKQAMVQSLSVLRQELCCYTKGSKTCDCKFGVKPDDHADTEHTGCVEIREILTLLMNMTDAEYKAILSRKPKTQQARVRALRGLRKIVKKEINHPFGTQHDLKLLQEVFPELEKMLKELN